MKYLGFTEKTDTVSVLKEPCPKEKNDTETRSCGLVC